MAASKDPHDLVWWKDEDGNFQQMTRHAVEAAGLEWTEVTRGFPVNAAAEDDPAAPAADSSE